MAITWSLAVAGLLAGQTGNYGPVVTYPSGGQTFETQSPAPSRFWNWRRTSDADPQPQAEESRPFLSRIGDRFNKLFGRGDEPAVRSTTTGPQRGTVIFDDGKGTFHTFPGGSTTAEPPLGAPSTAPAQRLPVGPGGGSAPVQTPAPGPLKLSSYPTSNVKQVNDGIIPTFKSATVPASVPATSIPATALIPASRVPSSPAEIASRPNRISAGFADKVGRDEKFEWITGQLRQENGRWVLWYATPEVIDPYEGRLPIATDADMSNFRDGDLVSAHGSVASQGRTAAYRATRVDLIQHEGR